MAKAEPKKPNRLPKDFNQMKPDDLQITNPERAEAEAAGLPIDVEYPKHLHKVSIPGQAYEHIEVVDAKDEAAKRREGWSSVHELNAAQRKADADVPKAPKPAKAPAAPKAPKEKKAPKAKAAAEPGAPASN